MKFLVRLGYFFARKENHAMQYREIMSDAHVLARDEKGRNFLSYLVSCALPSTQGVYAVVDGQRYDFPGDMGLAPEWLDRPLTETEQRWVSAGILARTNFFGKKLEISLRNPASGFESLTLCSEESRMFTLYEGDFFGNLFTEPTLACVAAAPRTPEQAQDPVFALRVGTEVDPQFPRIGGKPLTRCGFILTGSTEDPDAHSFNGVHYNEFIRVYLKPQKNG